MNDRAPVVAVVGATGAAGSTLLRVLEDRIFPMSDFRALASARSAGTTLRFRDHDVEVREVGNELLSGVDIAFFAAGSKVAREFAPQVAKSGGVAVDKSSAYRIDPDVPLIVPEVNAEALANHKGIVSNPNCVTIPLTVTLAPLHRQWGLKQVTLATYQAASGGGRDLVAELAAQERADAAGNTPARVVYPHVLHGNVVPGGWAMDGDDTEEEVKIVAEARRVFGLPELAISVRLFEFPSPSDIAVRSSFNSSNRRMCVPLADCWTIRRGFWWSTSQQHSSIQLRAPPPAGTMFTWGVFGWTAGEKTG